MTFFSSGLTCRGAAVWFGGMGLAFPDGRGFFTDWRGEPWCDAGIEGPRWKALQDAAKAIRQNARKDGIRSFGHRKSLTRQNFCYLVAAKANHILWQSGDPAGCEDDLDQQRAGFGRFGSPYHAIPVAQFSPPAEVYGPLDIPF